MDNVYPLFFYVEVFGFVCVCVCMNQCDSCDYKAVVFFLIEG